MRAVVVHEFGGPEVMRVEEWPRPSVGAGEVLVRIRAVGVNFADHLQRRGAYRGQQPPLIPGMELAGEIAAIGPAVEGLALGQRVCGWSHGTYAEYAAVRADRLLPIPDYLSDEQAACLPIVFGTAWTALIRLARLHAGERVLVHAAGSGVGSAAIQIAHQRGAWVLATAGAEWKLDRARDLGADATIDYAPVEHLAEEIRRQTEGEGVDVVLEGVGRATFQASLAALRDGGRMVVYGSPSGARVELDTRLAIFRNLTIYGFSITGDDRVRQSIADLGTEALPLFRDERLRVVIDRIYPLEEAAEAHQRLLDRAQFGKLVLRVD
jgi:NADPH2:quinone reductase